MTVPFMRAYTELLVRTCHKRGAHAIGGMAAFIPSKDEQTNERAFAKVRDDKTREAGDGFDGSWVAHPGMVALCTEVFTSVLGDAPDQRDKLRDDVEASADQLLDVASTRRGHRGGPAQQRQRRPAVPRVVAAGTGAVGINNLMEDAATAEISRSQVWQWLHNSIRLPDGQVITAELVNRMIDEGLAAIRSSRGEDALARGGWDEARSLFTETAISDEYVDFLTLPAYERMP